MEDPTIISRWQFAFTIVYHYLFPQRTMGLAQEKVPRHALDAGTDRL